MSGNLQGVDLRVHLRGANLRANLQGANLSQADFKGITQEAFEEADLGVRIQEQT